MRAASTHMGLVALACALLVSFSAAAGVSRGAPHARNVRSQSEKESRTPAQQKIDSQLLQEIYRKRGQASAKEVPAGKTDVRVDARGRALVDIRAPVTTALTSFIKKNGGSIVSTSAQYQSIVARVPLLKLERLAARPEVRAISPAPEAETRTPR
jgi:hypothetical protein